MYMRYSQYYSADAPTLARERTIRKELDSRFKRLDGYVVSRGEVRMLEAGGALCDATIMYHVLVLCIV